MTDYNQTSLTVSFGPSPNDGGSPILHYVLEKKESWKTVWTYAAKISPEEGTMTHCADALREEQDYDFRAYAVNSVGESKSTYTTTPFRPRKPFSK